MYENNPQNIILYFSDSQLGVRVPLGVREKIIGGARNLKKCSKEALLGRIFDLGLRKGHIILSWGYAEGYNFDLGVRGYQKVENPCSTSAILNLGYAYP
jgi:hypothetical protein